MSQQQSQKTNTHLPLPQRINHSSWLTRKTAFQQIQHLLLQQQTQQASINQPIFIGGQQYTSSKLIPFLTDLSDQKHTTVLLKGLSCVQLILKKKMNKRCKSDFGKYFLKLVNQGLQKFPLLIQLRNVVLQKFSQILDLIQIQPRVLKDKLSLPHQKSIFFALQIISHLQMKILKDDVKYLSSNHPKQQVRELASQILQQLQFQKDQQADQYKIRQESSLMVHDQNINYNQNKNSQKEELCIRTNNIKKNIMKKKQKSYLQSQKQKQKTSYNQKKNYLLDQMPHFQKLKPKQQQTYTSQLLSNIDNILQLPLPTTLDFAHYLRLMIQDNNFIISTNGIKILTSWLKNTTTINQIPNSYPLLFFFDKFKMHSTHQINNILFQLVDALIGGNRVIDLMQAATDGLSSSKGNVKYGAAMICVRVVSIMQRNEDLFYQHIQGQKQFPQHLQIPANKYKNLQKYLNKCCQLMLKDKDKVLKGISQSIRIEMGYSIQTQSKNSRPNSTANVGNRMKNMMNNISNTRSNQHINNCSSSGSTPINNKHTLTTSGSMNIANNSSNNTNKMINKISKKPVFNQQNNKTNNKILQQLMKKIIKLSSQPNLYSQKQLTQVLNLFTNEMNSGLQQSKYSLFYLSEVLQSLLRNYIPNQQNAFLISQFLINNIKSLSIQKSKASNAQNIQHLSIILKISLCQIVLGKRIKQILNNLLIQYSIKQLIKILDNLQGKVRKKNRQCLIQWLNSQTSVQLLNDRYYQLIRKISSGSFLNEQYGIRIQLQKQQKIKERQKYQYQYQCQRQQKQKQKQKQKYNNGITKLKFNNQNSQQQVKQYNYKNKYNQNTNNQVQIQISSDQEQNKAINKAKIQIQQLNKNIHKKPVKNNKFKQSLNKYTRQQQQIQLQKQQVNQKKDENHNYNIDNNYNNRKFIKNTSSFNNNNNYNTNDKQYYPTYQQLKQNTIKNNNFNYPITQRSQKDQSLHNINHLQCQISHIVNKQDDNNQCDQKWDYFLTKHNANGINKSINNNSNHNSPFKQQKYYQQSKQKSSSNKQIQKSQIFQKSPYKCQYKIQQKSYLQQDQQRQHENLKKISQKQQYLQQQQEDDNYSKKIKQLKKWFSQKNNYEQQQQNNKQTQQSKQLKQNKKNNYKSSISSQQQQKANYSQLQSSPKNKQQIKKYYIQQNHQNNLYQQQSQEQNQKLNQSQQQQYYQSKKNTNDEYQYEILNVQKLNYMLNCTSNPFPHLRSLILNPFKSHTRKHHFLQQLTNYISHKSLKTPQPYNAVLLLIILLFSQIKVDKSLIGPLQHLYQYLASLDTTNFFLKTILSLMHSVIQETPQSARSFLITILSKSISRLLPFVEDPVQLLRDIQQFYQIGQMVYFQMYITEYTQIKAGIQGNSLQQAIGKAIQQQGHNLIVIVQGWLQTSFKQKVKIIIQKLQALRQQNEEEIS